VSRLTQDTTRYCMHFVYGTITRYGPTFQKCSTMHADSTAWSYNPGTAETVPVWAVPFSLATTGGITTCFLFLQVLRCFSSLGSLPFQGDWSSTSRVAPFGDPRITGYYAPPRGLSQPIASFIASESQGIHRTPLVTFRSLEDPNCSVDRSLGLFWSVQQHVKERCPGWATTSVGAERRFGSGTVENIGVEPMTSCLQSRRSSQLS
jgi:hypothetical protein